MKKNLPLETTAFLFFLILPLILCAAGPAAVKKKNEHSQNASPPLQGVKRDAPHIRASHPATKRTCHHGRHRCVVSEEDLLSNHPRDMPTTIFEDKPFGSKQSKKKSKNPLKIPSSLEE